MKSEDLIKIMTFALYLESLQERKFVKRSERKQLLAEGKILQEAVNLDVYLEKENNIFKQVKLKFSPIEWQKFRDKAINYYVSGLRLTYPELSTWPIYLNSIPDPPLWLWYKGKDPSVINRLKPVAVVGSRKIIPYSRYVCRNVIEQLCESQHPVISGLALGVDALAHRTCLKFSGITGAVLPRGLADCYPTSHRQLLEEICENGFVISEFPPDYPVRKENFHYRNRLISGLSVAVIIIQAGSRSGSLITGRTAVEQSRRVIVVPGTMEMPEYRGSLSLIADGAELLSNYEDLRLLSNLDTTYLASLGAKVHKIEPAPLKQTKIQLSNHEQNVTRQVKQLRNTSHTVCANLEEKQALVEKADSREAYPDNLDKALLQAVHSGCVAKNYLAESFNLPIAEINVRIEKLKLERFLLQKRANLILTEKAISCIYY